MGKRRSLSPSKIGVLRDCARCFYDANNLNVARPRGIFPSLPGGVDRAMKEHTDRYRGAMMPELRDYLSGVLWGNVEQINKLRNWKSGLRAIVTVDGEPWEIIGALDDLILEADGTYSPFDTKTKGDVPKDDGSQYYQEQMDIYALFLRENGMTPSGKAYLAYKYPVSLTMDGIAFATKPYTLTASPDRAIDTITKAVRVLNGKRPAAAAECEYCQFTEKRIAVEKEAVS